MTVQMNLARRLAGGVLALAAMFAPVIAIAQSSSQRTVTVPFGGATGDDGYVSASVGVTYAFIACQGEAHIAYSLNEGSATAGSAYRLGGKVYPAAGAPPQPSSITFAGTIYRGPGAVGTFADGLTGKALGMGCFSGQTQKFGNLADLVGSKATPAQIQAYFNSLRIVVRPTSVLRSAAVESTIRGDLRRAEADAAANKRKAEQAQQASAKQAEQQKAASQAPQQAAKPAPAATASSSAASAVRTSPEQLRAQAAQAQREADAARSKELYAEGERTRAALAATHQQQYQKFQAQMAANEAERLRQSQAVIAAAPALAALGGGLEDLINGPYYRAKERQFQAAQAKLGGQCFIAGTQNPAPRNGLVRFGAVLSDRLEKADCGYSSTLRFKAYMLVVDTPGRATFTVSAGGGLQSGRYALDVIAENGQNVLALRSQEYRPFQRSGIRTVELQPGVYTVAVNNYYEFEFLPFQLRVDFTDASGRAIVEAKPSPAPLPASAPQTPVAVASRGAAGTPNVASAHLWGTLGELAGREWAAAGTAAGARQRFIWSDSGRTLSWQQAGQDGAWSDWYIFTENENTITVRLAGGRSRGTVSVDPAGVAVARVGSLGATTRFARNGDGFDIVYRPIPVTWKLTPAANAPAGAILK